ncbi:MAG: hypothetical protein V4692_01010 [Bdellovibrionota bacterium]
MLKTLIVLFALTYSQSSLAAGAGKNFAFAVSLCKTASKTESGDAVIEKQSNAKCMQAAESKAETSTRFDITSVVCEKHTGGKKEIARKHACYVFAADKLAEKACQKMPIETPDEMKKSVECYRQFFEYKVVESATPKPTPAAN